MEWRERLSEAVGAAGPGALASGRSASLLWGIRIGPPVMEVWTPASPLHLPGLVPSVRHDIAVVDAATMLLQLVTLRTPVELTTAAEAVAVPLDELSARAHRWVDGRGPALKAVRTLIDHLDGAAKPDSALEARFLAVLDRAGLLSRAVLHHPVSIGSPGHRVELDIAFPDHRVAVELDGWAYHRSRESFASDRTRDVELSALGWLVLRFTHADVERRPAWVLQQLRATLAARR